MTEKDMTAYQKIRYQNLLVRQEMLNKIGLNPPSSEPNCSTSASLPHKRRGAGRPPKKALVESSDEDYRIEEDDDDDDWLNRRAKRKKRCVSKKASFAVPKKNTFQTANSGKDQRYPKRDTTRPSYKDTYIPGSDDMLYCADCQCEWEGDCPEHGPLLVVQDTPIPPNVLDQSRAKKTAPAIVTVADSKIPEAGTGVWARDFVPARVRFGPYVGKIVSHEVRNAYSWLVRKNGRPHHCVDATEAGTSNWMRFVNCARYDGEQNLEAFQYGGDIYYRTLRRIAPHEELLVWYGDDYGRQLGINPEICDAEDEEKWKEMRFKCTGCEFSYISPLYLERHKKVCRQLKVVEKPGQTYQCPGCKFLYSDAEYLARHKRFCRKMQYSLPSTETIVKNEEKEGLPYNLDTGTDNLDTEKTQTCTSEKLTTQKVEKDLNLKVQGEESVNNRRGTELRPSSTATIDLSSEDDSAAEDTNDRGEHQPGISAEILTDTPVVSTEDQSEGFTENFQNKFDTSTENQSEVLTKKKLEFSMGNRSEVTTEHKLAISTENRPDVFTEDQLGISTDNQSDAFAEDRPGVATENQSEVCTEDQLRVSTENQSDFSIGNQTVSCGPQTEMMKIKPCYVRLERMYWFLDSRIARKTFHCPNCNERFYEQRELAEHNSHHRTETLFLCSKCPKMFCARKRLMEHVKIHTKCSEVLDRQDGVSKSVKTKPEQNRDHMFRVCSDCHEIFDENEDLQNHYCKLTSFGKSATFPSKAPLEDACYACVDCKKSFGNIQRLMLHLVTHREGEKFANEVRAEQYVTKLRDLQSCLVNGEKIFFPEGAEQFSLSHTLTTSLSLKLGGRLISTESSLRLSSKSSDNITKSEPNNTPLQISASLKNYLKTPKESFVCSECNARFANKGTLIVHRRSHRNEKPFICRVCKKGFLHSGSFQEHILAHKAEQIGFV